MTDHLKTIREAVQAALKDAKAGHDFDVKPLFGKLLTALDALEAAMREPWTAREIELIDGMIAVQMHHAEQCDRIGNRTMAEKQKSWDMERVALLQKIRAAAPPAQQAQAEAVPIGVVVAIDASDPENGPDAIVALHRDVALGAKLYDRPPSQGAEIAELKDLLRISVENCESQRKKAERATATIYDIHYALKDAGWHPGRTDDKLTDIIRAKGERMRELEAEPGIRLTPEEIEALRLTMSSAVLFSRAKNTSDIRSSVLTRFDQFFEHVKDHVRPHQPDPEAVAEGLAQIIFEAINPGKVWTYQTTDVRNAYWSAGQAAKEFLK